MAERKVSHAQALDLIEEHLGEQVYFGFLVASGDGEGQLVPIEHRRGALINPLEPDPPRLEPDQGLYSIGTADNAYHLPPLSGTVHLRDNGIDFRVAETALIRIAWRGSTEVGDWRPTREGLAKLNSIGIKLPEHEKPGVELRGSRGESIDSASAPARGGLRRQASPRGRRSDRLSVEQRLSVQLKLSTTASGSGRNFAAHP